MDFEPVENYGVIGNMQCSALVGMSGSIDFLCYPNFDSPTLFAALLDSEKGGSFCIKPELEAHHTKQLYLPDTNILVTRFLSADGVAEVTDFMPLPREDQKLSEVVRMVRVVKGSICFCVRCDPRFDYARSSHTAAIEGDRVVFYPGSKACPTMSLSSTIPLQLDGGAATGCFTLNAGETATFVFGAWAEGAGPLDLSSIVGRFDCTARFWREWISKSTYTGRWREMVNRSALLLKLLVSQQHGSLIAAPTFGLPEKMGGERNWDYRYTWLRDSAFSLYALIRLGFVEESEAFIRWLKDRLSDDAERGPLQVMYGIDGRKELQEYTLDHLRGYGNSVPVRVGNAAYEQLQLDIYGEMLDSIYLSNKYGDAISHGDWGDVKRILAWLSKNWQRPDDGIWEVRGGPKEFLHSRLMCWVAFDRAIRLGQKRSLSAPYIDWYATRDAIHEDIYEHFWSEKRQAFVQSKGSELLDAAVLLMPMMRFISPVDPMWLSTMQAIEGALVEDTLVYRYDTASHLDGLSGDEGSFTACSFWYIECLARGHQLEKAQLLFEKMLGYANHLGLYSEQLGRSGEHLGNFPQALTHLALISTATYLDRQLSGKGDAQWRNRAERATPPNEFTRTDGDTLFACIVTVIEFYKEISMAEKAEDKQEPEHFAKIHELIKDIHFAMLTTEGTDGVLHSRPMATQQAQFDGKVWFLTRQDSGKVNEIVHDAHVNLTYTGGKQTFVSLSGTAEISKDRKIIDELWNPLYKAWFPEGKEDPEITILVVHVTEAEYWEAPANAVVRNIKILSAALTGGKVKVGEHEKVDL